MFGLGVAELLIIAAILVLFFGASRLPGLGSAVGKAIKGFRDSLSGGETKRLAPGEETPDEEKRKAP